MMPLKKKSDHPAYASGVLVEEHHDRLVQNLNAFAKDAGIQPRWISTKLADTCGPAEVNYVKKFNFLKASGEVDGLCYLRTSGAADPDRRMAALAGAFVRNFIRARVMTLGTVFDHTAKGGRIDATVLLIPNFCLSKSEGGAIAAWQSQAMVDLLMQRAQDGQQTVLYATSLADVGAMYGTLLARTIETRFRQVGI